MKNMKNATSVQKQIPNLPELPFFIFATFLLNNNDILLPCFLRFLLKQKGMFLLQWSNPLVILRS